MRYLVGSRYFFSQYSDFKPKDSDYIEFVDIIPDNWYINGDIFYILDSLSKEEIVYQVIDGFNSPVSIGRFLNKEFSEKIGFTIEDLKHPGLKKEADRCHKKHEYVKMIYYFYIQNNSFTLTEEQRLAAYENYKAARPEIYGKKEKSV